MESQEWRTKQLEDSLPGPIDQDQLIRAANCYMEFIKSNGESYEKFLKSHGEFKNYPFDQTNYQVSDTTKTELVLAYEGDLVRHLENVKTLADKADKVLDVEEWPDLSGFEGKLRKPNLLTQQQHLQSITLDSKIGELIETYNDIINSFKRNAATWNQWLESYEMEEKELDEPMREN